ncbi:hypothetical protein [Mycoplasmopsis agassizii]|nr:hypothetical protein [Mycoplasmopsis agassizii]
MTKIEASMWFVDDSFRKNKNFYSSKIKKIEIDNYNVNLYYGAEQFHKLNGGIDAWNEIISHLKRYRKESVDRTLENNDLSNNP